MAPADSPSDVPEDEDEPIGSLPLSRLTRRASKSALASKRREILRDLALSPLERVEKALELGAELRKLAKVPEGHEGRLVSLEYLILFKLYAGGSKSRGDIEELLARRKADLPLLRNLAQKYGLERELERVLDSEE